MLECLRLHRNQIVDDSCCWVVRHALQVQCVLLLAGGIESTFELVLEVQLQPPLRVFFHVVEQVGADLGLQPFFEARVDEDASTQTTCDTASALGVRPERRRTVANGTFFDTQRLYILNLVAYEVLRSG